jgi:hypothetical protein
VSVKKVETTCGQSQRIVQFAPVGRSYLPETFDELMDALICVGETLVALGAIDIMHCGIRWANIFHALDESKGRTSFTKE